MFFLRLPNSSGVKYVVTLLHYKHMINLLVNLLFFHARHFLNKLRNVMIRRSFGNTNKVIDILAK